MVNEHLLQQAGMDLPDLLKRLMGNEKLVGMFVRKFLEDGNYRELVSAVERQDWDGALHASHTLKGMCGNLSLKELFVLFDSQVRLLRAGEYVEAGQMMAEIAPAFETCTAGLQSWLQA